MIFTYYNGRAHGLPKQGYRAGEIAISSASGKPYTALTLPFAPRTGGRGGAGGRGAGAGAPTTSPLTFIDGGRSIRFGSGGFLWTCSLTDYACTKGSAIPPVAPGRGGRGGVPADDADDPLASPEMVGGDPGGEGGKATG